MLNRIRNILNIKNFFEFIGGKYMKKKLLLVTLGALVASSFNATKIQAATYKYNQDATAYSAGTTTASGKKVEVGYVAVHWKGSNQTSSVIPFGTYIYIDNISSGSVSGGQFVPTPEGEVHVWRVEDTGLGPGKSTYWLDFYLGDVNAEVKFGNGKVSYHY